MHASRKHAAGTIAPLILALMLSCGVRGLREEEMMGFFPSPTDVPGWAAKEAPAHYERTNMPLILSGERASMREFGVVEAAVSEYTSINEQKRVVTAAVFRTTSPLDAFGLIGRATGFRGRKNDPEGFEDCGVSGKGDFVFRKREYYVEISVNPAYPGSDKDVIMFAQHMNGAMQIIPPVEPGVIFLPGQPKERNAIVYCKNGCNGMLPVPDAYVRVISREGRERKVFYARRNGRESAIREFYGLMGGGTPHYTLMSTEGYMSAYGEPAGSGFTVIGAWDTWIFGTCEAFSLSEAAKITDIVYRSVRNGDNK